MNGKRITICVIGGVIAGIICVLGMKSSGRMEVTTPILLSSIGNRVLIGFVIGISGWRMHYLLHGALIGLLVTLSSSVAIPNMNGFLLYTIAGMVYGLLIELAATKFFKAGMR